MSELKSKRAPSVSSNERAWSQVYDDINDIVKAVNSESGVESRDGASGKDGDIRLFKDVDRTKYFIEGKFGDGWAKRELLFSDNNDAGQDETINFSSTETYIKPDGTVPFTAAPTSVAPSNDLHLATKKYVDDNATDFSFTGDITGGSGSATVNATIATNAVENSMMADNAVNTAEITNNAVTYAKLQQINTDTFLGRDTAGTGNVEEITLSQLETMLNLGQYLSVASTNTLTDVTVNNSTVTTGHYLRHNGTNFINNAGIPGSDITGLAASHIPALATSKITSGTFDNAQIKESSVTQHTAAIKSTGSLMSNFFLRHGDNSTTSVDEDEQIKIVTAQGSYGTGVINTSNGIHTITLSAPDTNQQTTFTLTGDNGANATISHGNTLDVEGGNGISTAVGSPDKVTISVTGNLNTLSNLNVSDGNFIVGNGSAFTVESGATAQSSLGLGSAAVRDESFFKLTGATETVGRGGTGHDELTNNAVLTGNGTNPISVESNFVYDGTSLGVNTSSPRAVSGYSLVTINTTGANGAGIDFQLSGTSKASVYTVAGTLYADAVTSHIFRTGGAMGGTTALTLSSSQVATFASTIRGGADVVAYYSSDPTLKENKKLIENPLDKISQLGGYSFDWKKEAKDMVGDHLNGKDYGVMADEVQALFPELVDTRSNGIRAVKYDKLVPLLIEGIKELKQELNIIKEQLQ